MQLKSVGKVKFVPLHAGQAQRGGKSVDLPIFDLGAKRLRVVSTTPMLLYPRERDPLLNVQEAGCVLKNLTPLQFEPWTVQQPLASCYTDLSKPHTSLNLTLKSVDKSNMKCNPLKTNQRTMWEYFPVRCSLIPHTRKTIPLQISRLRPPTVLTKCKLHNTWCTSQRTILPLERSFREFCIE